MESGVGRMPRFCEVNLLTQISELHGRLYYTELQTDFPSTCCPRCLRLRRLIRVGDQNTKNLEGPQQTNQLWYLMSHCHLLVHYKKGTFLNSNCLGDCYRLTNDLLLSFVCVWILIQTSDFSSGRRYGAVSCRVRNRCLEGSSNQNFDPEFWHVVAWERLGCQSGWSHRSLCDEILLFFVSKPKFPPFTLASGLSISSQQLGTLMSEACWQQCSCLLIQGHLMGC